MRSASSALCPLVLAVACLLTAASTVEANPRRGAPPVGAYRPPPVHAPRVGPNVYVYPQVYTTPRYYYPAYPYAYGSPARWYGNYSYYNPGSFYYSYSPYWGASYYYTNPSYYYWYWRR